MSLAPLAYYAKCHSNSLCHNLHYHILFLLLPPSPAAPCNELAMPCFCVFLFICSYVCMHVCVMCVLCICVHVYMHVFVFICICVFMLYTCMCACVCLHVFMCTICVQCLQMLEEVIEFPRTGVRCVCLQQNPGTLREP